MGEGREEGGRGGGGGTFLAKVTQDLDASCVNVNVFVEATPDLAQKPAHASDDRCAGLTA